MALININITGVLQDGYFVVEQEPQPIELTCGDNCHLIIEVFAGSGLPLDITGGALLFSLRNGTSLNAPLLLSREAVLTNAGIGDGYFLINSDDTIVLSPTNSYNYDIVYIDSFGNQAHIIPSSKFALLKTQYIPGQPITVPAEQEPLAQGPQGPIGPTGPQGIPGTDGYMTATTPLAIDGYSGTPIYLSGNHTITFSGSASETLSAAYAAGSSPTDSTLFLDSTRGGFQIWDNATPISDPLFVVAQASGVSPRVSITPDFGWVGNVFGGDITGGLFYSPSSAGIVGPNGQTTFISASNASLFMSSAGGNTLNLAVDGLTAGCHILPDLTSNDWSIGNSSQFFYNGFFSNALFAIRLDRSDAGGMAIADTNATGGSIGVNAITGRFTWDNTGNATLNSSAAATNGYNLGAGNNLLFFGHTSLGIQMTTNGTLFLPSTDNVMDLGSSGARFKSLHLGPGSLIIHNDSTDNRKLTLNFSGNTGQLIASTISTGNGTTINIQAGQGSTATLAGFHNGGTLLLKGGQGGTYDQFAGGFGGPVQLLGGLGADGFDDGMSIFFDGRAGGAVTISGGRGGSGTSATTSGDGGDLSIFAGSAGAGANGGNGASLYLDAGSKGTGGFAGNIQMGLTYAGTIQIGSTVNTNTTTLNGNEVDITSAGQMTLNAGTLMAMYVDNSLRWSIGADGHLLPGNGNTYNIGSNSLPVQNGYFGGTVTTATLVSTGIIYTTTGLDSNVPGILYLGGTASGSGLATGITAKHSLSIINGQQLIFPDNGPLTGNVGLIWQNVKTLLVSDGAGGEGNLRLNDLVVDNSIYQAGGGPDIHPYGIIGPTVASAGSTLTLSSAGTVQVSNTLWTNGGIETPFVECPNAGQLQLYGGSVAFYATEILPSADNATNVGDTSHRFKDGYFSGRVTAATSYANSFGAIDPDFPGDGPEGTFIAVASSRRSTLNVDNIIAAHNSEIVLGGTADQLKLFGGKWSWNTAGNNNYNLIPDTNNAYDIGDTSHGVRTLYTNDGYFGDGSAASPAITFTSDSNTGFYHDVADQVGVSVNGTRTLEIRTGGIIYGSLDTSFVQLNGTSCAFSFSGVDLALNASSLTTGVKFLPASDSVYDIGSSSQKFRDGYFNGTITSPHFAGSGTAPTIAVGTAVQLGTTPSAAVTQGSDTGGVITITTGTFPSVFVGGVATTLGTVTFNTNYASAPKAIVLTPANAAAALAMSGATGVVFYVDYANTTTSVFTVNAIDSGAGVLIGSTAYAFTYLVVQ